MRFFSAWHCLEWLAGVDKEEQGLKTGRNLKIVVVKKVDYSKVVFERNDVRSGKCFHGRHVGLRSAQGTDDIFGKANFMELG